MENLTFSLASSWVNLGSLISTHQLRLTEELNQLSKDSETEPEQLRTKPDKSYQLKNPQQTIPLLPQFQRLYQPEIQ